MWFYSCRYCWEASDEPTATYIGVGFADFRTPSGQLSDATPAHGYGDLWPFEWLELMDTRIVSLDADATRELYILTNDKLGPYGTTGKVYKLFP